MNKISIDEIVQQLKTGKPVCVCEPFCGHWEAHAAKVLRSHLSPHPFQYRECKLFAERDFHDWRWLGWPLGSIIPVRVTEKWCDSCGLRKKATTGGFVDTDYVLPTEGGYAKKPLTDQSEAK